MMGLEDERVLVVGLGASGEAAAVALVESGAVTVLIDSSPEPSRVAAAEQLGEKGIEVRLGVAVPDDLESFDLVVTSPGVPEKAPVLRKARSLGTRVVSELELGYRLLEGATMVAITGTNGKTTTTLLAAAMLDRPPRRALTCGNIGTPLVGLFGNTIEGDILVCEVSSFQLNDIEKFRAKVSVVLNLAPDHFDWHADMDEYARAKMRLIENMTPGDLLVYNADDPFCVEMSREAGEDAVGFSRRGLKDAGILVEDGRIVTGGRLGDGPLLDVDDIGLVGAHNLDNVMAAAASALLLGEDRLHVAEAAAGFRGLEHRCEPAGEVVGVRFYNDSKATNPHACLQAVASFDRPFVVIMGGRNKGLEFDGLAVALRDRLDEGTLMGIVLMGESADEIEEALRKVGIDEGGGSLRRAADLEDAVSIAHSMARDGGAVLFSPACASFDQFTDYKDRGKAFKAAVERLAGGAPRGGIE
jgi:UDP-N-acetylmuramoylalanine--D-glutamate ligase